MRFEQQGLVPACRSDPDVAPDPLLLPPNVAERPEQNVPCDVLRRRPRYETAMNTILTKVAALDVHQKFNTIGVRWRLETGKLFADVRELGTMTRDLTASPD